MPSECWKIPENFQIMYAYDGQIVNLRTFLDPVFSAKNFIFIKIGLPMTIGKVGYDIRL